jgi:ankyrin repeat protein
MSGATSHYHGFSATHRSMPASEAHIDDRVDHFLNNLQISTTDCHGLMRHVLDCLGALRVRAKVDHRMTPAIREVFKSACNKFLDAVVQEQDETHEDGSAIHLLMNVFPDERKRRDGRGWLPLHWAASLDDCDEEHMKSVARERPLNASSTHESTANAVLTLEQQAGVEPIARGTGLLPLHFICSLKHPRLTNIKTILSLYPDAVKIPEEAKKWLPLHFAAYNCMSQEAIRFLLDVHLPAIYAPTSRGQLPFLLAMHNNRAEILDEILDPNPDALDGCDLKGNTAAHYAARNCNPEAAKRIIRLHPEIAAMKNFNDELPIHKAFVFINSENKRSRWRQLELLRILLDENPETVSPVDKDGNLPLHLAVGFNASFEVCAKQFIACILPLHCCRMEMATCLCITAIPKTRNCTRCFSGAANPCNDWVSAAASPNSQI